jgi:hypothetical protein
MQPATCPWLALQAAFGVHVGNPAALIGVLNGAEGPLR